jgi:hypothetical protein
MSSVLTDEFKSGLFCDYLTDFADLMCATVEQLKIAVALD